MRETLLAFVRATQRRAVNDDGRFEVHMSTGGVEPEMSIQFGYGYHDGDKVLCYGPDKDVEGGRVMRTLSPEEAVDLYLKQFGVCP